VLYHTKGHTTQEVVLCCIIQKDTLHRKWSCGVSYKRTHYTGSGLVLYHTTGHTTQEVVLCCIIQKGTLHRKWSCVVSYKRTHYTGSGLCVNWHICFMFAGVLLKWFFDNDLFL